MDMGEKIKALRESRGMTLEQLGNLVGVGKSTVRKWENGMIANMRRDKISKIAAALNVSPAYLMGWDENDSAPAAPIPLVLDDVSNTDLKAAMRLYSLYEHAPDHIRQTIDIILKSSQSDSGQTH